MCSDSLWIDNKPFSSSMLAQDEYNPGAIQKKSSSPWIHVKQQGKNN
jgi:hypothetical protein